MRNNIAALLELSSPLDDAEFVTLQELGHILGLSRRQALKLTQRGDFPEPVLSLHRRVLNETKPQPRPVWDVDDIEHWAKKVLSVPN
jgi:hypothetical protein